MAEGPFDFVGSSIGVNPDNMTEKTYILGTGEDGKVYGVVGPNSVYFEESLYADDEAGNVPYANPQLPVSNLPSQYVNSDDLSAWHVGDNTVYTNVPPTVPEIVSEDDFAMSFTHPSGAGTLFSFSSEDFDTSNVGSSHDNEGLENAYEFIAKDRIRAVNLTVDEGWEGTNLEAELADFMDVFEVGNLDITYLSDDVQKAINDAKNSMADLATEIASEYSRIAAEKERILEERARLAALQAAAERGNTVAANDAM